MMSKPYRWVDLSKFPTDEKGHIIELGQQFNALSSDVDRITGVTTDDKEQTYTAFAAFRKFLHLLHGKRANVALASLQVWLLLSILRQFGVQPEQIARLVEAVIKILERVTP